MFKATLRNTHETVGLRDKQVSVYNPFEWQNLWFVTNENLSHIIRDEISDEMILSPILMGDNFLWIGDQTSLSLKGFSLVVLASAVLP